METKQPPRGETDGAVEISRMNSDTLCIACTTNGVRDVIICTDYNAWRIFGMLSVILGAKLSARLQKSIKF